MPDYGMSVTLTAGYADAVARTREALAEQGFGVLTEIDVAATMKTKLDVDLPPYVILGACNPPLAYRAITAEASIGLLLPCNVVVRSIDADTTLVEAMDPEIMVKVTDVAELRAVADEAKAKLAAALKTLAPTDVPA
jgi:uncharacterized protein (DUF302 family)